MPLDHGLGQCHPHPVQVRPIQRVLKPRQRRLRRQILSTNRIPITEQLLDRVRSQAARIIAIRVAAGDRIQALARQVADCVTDLARLASVIDAADQRRGETEPPIARVQQDRSAVRTGVRLVKLRDHRSVAQIRKQDRLSCAIVVHAKAS